MKAEGRRSDREWTTFGVLVASVCILLSCNDKPICGPNPVPPSQEIEGFTVHESSSGKRLYTLEAQTRCSAPM